jgi:hypothetical protein
MNNLEAFLAERGTVEATIQSGRTSPNPAGVSQKERLFNFLKDHANSRGRVPLTAAQISKAIQMEGHEVAHLIKDSLFKENLVTFRGKTGDKGPNSIRSIRLTAKAMGREFKGLRLDSSGWPLGRPSKQEKQMALSEALAEMPKTAIAQEKPQTQTSEKFPIVAPKKFPLIEALAKRKETLSLAAKLAEEGGAEDLAISLSWNGQKCRQLRLKCAIF